MILRVPIVVSVARDVVGNSCVVRLNFPADTAMLGDATEV